MTSFAKLKAELRILGGRTIVLPADVDFNQICLRLKKNLRRSYLGSKLRSARVQQPLGTMAYTEDAVKAKLSALNETQESIVTVAQWIMFHR